MVGWNATDVGEPTSDSFIRLFPIAQVLEETQALIDGTTRLSYSELEQQASGVASRLRAHGAGRGDLVLVVMRHQGEKR